MVISGIVYYCFTKFTVPTLNPLCSCYCHSFLLRIRRPLVAPCTVLRAGAVDGVFKDPQTHNEWWDPLATVPQPSLIAAHGRGLHNGHMLMPEILLLTTIIGSTLFTQKACQCKTCKSIHLSIYLSIYLHVYTQTHTYKSKCLHIFIYMYT